MTSMRQTIDVVSQCSTFSSMAICWVVRPLLLIGRLSFSKLEGKAAPRLLDEWQIVPQLWDTIRYEADHRKGFGHFILTGSSEMSRQSIFCPCAICKFGEIVYLCIPNGELAQLARALAWHARGHEFDSRILHLWSAKRQLSRMLAVIICCPVCRIGRHFRLSWKEKSDSGTMNPPIRWL